MGEEYTNKLVASLPALLVVLGSNMIRVSGKNLKKKNNGWLIGSLIKHYDGPQYVYR